MTRHMTKSLTFSKKTPVLSSIHTKSVFLNPKKYRGILGATAINNCITVLGPGVEEVHGFFAHPCIRLILHWKVVSELLDFCSFSETQGISPQHTALVCAPNPWRLVFHPFSAEPYSPTVLQSSYRYSQLRPRRNEFRQMSEGSIQWANVSHMAAAYPLEPSDLELGSPSQVHWSEKIKHQILLLRLQRRGFCMVGKGSR